ncbi:MAG: hypothetical protein HYX25_09145 [Candidatus Solibacter usitatus]|nr:hypothetical protein [Candidatus Solibacter usitatus]
MKSVIAILPVCALLALAHDHDRNRFDVEEKESTQHTYPRAATVDVDNFDGSITVTGSNTGDIQVVVNKTIRAESKEKIQEAKRDVKLDVSQSDSALHLYVDGPYRCHCGDGFMNFRGSRHYGYEVSYEFILKVPRETNLHLRTVNHGDISVKNTSGTFDVDNVNGGVEMLEVAGSGHAYALNRPLKVTFTKNPQANSYFGSLNGLVEVAFQPDLNADLRMKTFNGNFYTDFEVTPLPALPSTQERRNGKFVYRSNEFTGVRVGRGGPEIKFDAFNRDVRIIRRTK